MLKKFKQFLQHMKQFFFFQESMESEEFYRLYLTKIFKTFDCDTFFPKIPDDLKKVR